MGYPDSWCTIGESLHIYPNIALTSMSMSVKSYESESATKWALGERKRKDILGKFVNLEWDLIRYLVDILLNWQVFKILSWPFFEKKLQQFLDGPLSYWLKYYNHLGIFQTLKRPMIEFKFFLMVSNFGHQQQITFGILLDA